MTTPPPDPTPAAEGRSELVPAAFWDQRYASHPGYVYGEEPNAWLVRHRDRLRPGMTVLAIADGDGRNGVWLAEQGLDVHSVDQSQEGLRKARALADRRGVSIRTECAELSEWTWPESRYDLVVAVFAHLGPTLRRRVHRKVIGALKPGGRVILNGFSPDQHRYRSGGPENPALLFAEDDLRADFEGLEIESLVSYIGELDEGEVHAGPAALVGLVARKPVASSPPGL